LTYYSLVSGTETPYSFGSSTTIVWYYQQLYNPLNTIPVYDTTVFIPSDNSTSDITYATTTVAGKILLSSTSPSPVGSTAVIGSVNNAALADHAHVGVHSLAADGVSGSALVGDVLISAGAGISLSYSGQKIVVTGTAATVGFGEVPAGSVNGINTTFGPLTYAPLNQYSIEVYVDGVERDQATDWSLSGTSIVFTSAPSTGQTIWVWYLYGGVLPTPPPPPTGTENVEYRTITSGEASAKQLTLAHTPSTSNLVMVDAIGGGAQWFGVDFTVSSNILNWSGYGLDGILASGDTIRIHYWS